MEINQKTTRIQTPVRNVLDVSPQSVLQIVHLFEHSDSRSKGTAMATVTPFPASSALIRPVRADRSPSYSPKRSATVTSATRPPRPVRLTNRGRIVLATVASVLLSIMVVLSGQITADAGSAAGGPVLATYVVQPGESLWSIASEVAPAADPRETIAVIRDLNGMQDSTVVPGQSVVVPITS
jgi:hypothetical protein